MCSVFPAGVQHCPCCALPTAEEADGVPLRLQGLQLNCYVQVMLSSACCAEQYACGWGKQTCACVHLQWGDAFCQAHCSMKLRSIANTPCTQLSLQQIAVPVHCWAYLPPSAHNNTSASGSCVPAEGVLAGVQGMGLLVLLRVQLRPA